jgi:hypothetical protein
MLNGFQGSKLEGVIKEFWSFEETLIVNIELKKFIKIGLGWANNDLRLF